MSILLIEVTTVDGICSHCDSNCREYSSIICRESVGDDGSCGREEAGGQTAFISLCTNELFYLKPDSGRGFYRADGCEPRTGGTITADLSGRQHPTTGLLWSQD